MLSFALLRIPRVIARHRVPSWRRSADRIPLCGSWSQWLRISDWLWYAGEELPVEENPQPVAARLQWQEVLGTSEGPDAAKTVKTGALLGRFIGLKHIYSTEQRPVLQVGWLHPSSKDTCSWQEDWALYPAALYTAYAGGCNQTLQGCVDAGCIGRPPKVISLRSMRQCLPGVQALLVGLPLTALVAGLALALWRLAGPVSLRPGST